MAGGLARLRFGSARKKTGAQDAIYSIREQLALLQEREKQLQDKMAKQLAIARRNIHANEAVARESLELKKSYAEQCAKTQEHITTLHQQLFTLESANINMETLDVMEHAAKGVTRSGDKLSPEQMNRIKERLQEHNALRDAIAESKKHSAIATPADPVDIKTELEKLRSEESCLKMTI